MQNLIAISERVYCVYCVASFMCFSFSDFFFILINTCFIVNVTRVTPTQRFTTR